MVDLNLVLGFKSLPWPTFFLIPISYLSLYFYLSISQLRRPNFIPLKASLPVFFPHLLKTSHSPIKFQVLTSLVNASWACIWHFLFSVPISHSTLSMSPICLPARLGACRRQGLTVCMGEHFSPMYKLTIKGKKCLCLCLMCLTTQVAWLWETCTPCKAPSQGVPFLRIYFQNLLQFRSIKQKKIYHHNI